MCGITIFLSKNRKNIVKDIIKSLYQIQNRGYDSVGIGIRLEKPTDSRLEKPTDSRLEKPTDSRLEKPCDDWDIYKYASLDNIDSLDKLSGVVKEMSSTMAIGHTRWATHGGKTDINSHPHRSMNGAIILVHNGIISNFQDLKTFLEGAGEGAGRGYRFYSETDTEVIANLIEYYLLKNADNTILDAIRLATDRMCGTWALGIVSTKTPDTIYVTRHGSPLLLGYNDNTIICCSEVSGFIGQIYNYICLENNDIVTINQDGYTSNTSYVAKTVQSVTDALSPSPFPHWTIKEINDQPKSIMAAVNNGARILDNNIVLGGLTSMNTMLDNTTVTRLEHLIVLGCGTSYHASMLAKYYFSEKSRETFNTIQSFDASEFTRSDIPRTGKVLCIVCSQSGETRDLIKCIEICKEARCILFGVVNVVDSVIAQSVDCGVYMNAGREMAVPSTKSFTSTLIILSLIGMWFKERHVNIPVINCLRILPTTIESLLQNEEFRETCRAIADFINRNKITSIFILGRAKMFPIAKEGALKIKEITYIHAEGYAAGSLKHGPFALLDDKTVTLLLIDEKNKEYLTSTYYEIMARETHCYIITDCDDLGLGPGPTVLRLPKLKYYQEVLFTVALQYLSYILSVAREINPDKPRNLAKVVTVD